MEATRWIRPEAAALAAADGQAGLVNREGDSAFAVRWGWADGPLEPGFTAIIRIKNEARSLPWVLPPLLAATRRVLVVDNGSTDGSGELAHEVAATNDGADRLEVLEYPFSVSRCGPEHLGTPADSLSSLSYFYNWSFSHARTRYVLKWDGDMVMSEALVQTLRDLAWQLETSEAVVRIPRHPLYVADDRRGFVDTTIANREPWGWPNGPGYRFAKAVEWELSVFPADVPFLYLPRWSSIELKYLDTDEFSNWSDTAFEMTSRTRRKRREWETFHALATGSEPPEGVVPVESPDDRHIVDYVRTTWLPERARAVSTAGG